MNATTCFLPRMLGPFVVLGLAFSIVPHAFAQERHRDGLDQTLGALERAIELLHRQGDRDSVRLLKGLYDRIEHGRRSGSARDRHDGRERKRSPRHLQSEGSSWGKKNAKTKSKGDAYFQVVWNKLQAAVRAGKMSRRDAEEKMGWIKKQAAGKTHAKSKSKGDAYFRDVWNKLQAAVRAGKMSRRDAEQKMGWIKKQAASKKHASGKKPANKEGIWKKIQSAVRKGKVTREQAEQKWRGHEKGRYGADRRGEEWKPRSSHRRRGKDRGGSWR